MSEQKKPLDVVEEVVPKFSELKAIIDKYPNAFSIAYNSDSGYIIQSDLTRLELCLGKED